MEIKQTAIGVACDKHDLTTHLRCGHCYRAMEVELTATQQELYEANIAYDKVVMGLRGLANYEAVGLRSKSDIIRAVNEMAEKALASIKGKA